MLRKSKSPSFTREQQLAARPLRNGSVAWARAEDGMVTVTIERRADFKTRVLSLWSPVPARRKVELDELGSEVWEWCDGERSVRDLMEKFARKHKLSLKEAEQSLRKFLDDLAARRLIAYLVPSAPPAAVAKSASPKQPRRRRRKKKAR